ncbi:nuclear receptor coactivator 7 [Elysia marginata]|uniref:Nuclear receptor coactivator 7 n=1 Tax=Elysia marginata TaxID=1093978 RepID=A0AAV4FDN5_9GAST|nr:nuclear receptor coactivator 7 [Elysia marginata]
MQWKCQPWRCLVCTCPWSKDVPYVEMADRPMPAVPGHAVQVKTQAATANVKASVVRQPSREELDEADQECMKRFLKTPVRRFVDHVEPDSAEKSVIPCKGTLLLTPNALMFDPDVSDPLVVNCSNQSKYQLVVYMEDLKSAAIYTEYPKHKSSAVKAETYRGGDNHSSTSGSPSDGLGGTKVEKPDSESPQDTGRTSEELEKMGEMADRAPDLSIQPGRASEEIEHAMAGSGVGSPSILLKQMSRSSEAASCEISQLGAASDVFGETRDFGPHLGRSSSEVHRQLMGTNSGGSGRVSVSSPSVGGAGEVISTISGGRSESTSEGALSTPTQGFAPVHFTDRSPPNNVIAHPTPVSGQRASMTSSTGSEPGASQLSPPASLTPSAPQQSSQQLILSPSSLSELASCDQAGVPFSSSGRPLSQISINTSGSTSSSGTTTAADSHSLSALTSSVGSSTSADSTQQHPHPPSAGEKSREASATNTQHENSTKEGLMSSFSPSQQISNFFQFTSSFIRSAAGGQMPDKKSPTGAAVSTSPVVKVTPPGQAVKIKSGCTREEMDRALGPSPDVYQQKCEEMHCFTEKPNYLQLRPGIPCDRPKDAAPRAFDYRNEGGYLDEYWFAVPRNITDRLYNFLMTWRPEAYGDQEETAQRDKFFYDQREVKQLLLARQASLPVSQAEEEAGEGVSATTSATGKPRTNSVSSDLSYLNLTEDHFSDQEKAWVVSA